MVIGGKWVMTEDEIKKQEMEILYRHEKARKNLDALFLTVRQVKKKFSQVTILLGELEGSTFDVHGPATDLLKLPVMEYVEVLSLAAVKALSESVIRAQKELAEAAEDKRRLG